MTGKIVGFHYSSDKGLRYLMDVNFLNGYIERFYVVFNCEVKEDISNKWITIQGTQDEEIIYADDFEILETDEDDLIICLCI